MLVEHTFVTTSSADDALGAAARFLAERGFTAIEDHAFAVGGVAVPSSQATAAPVAAVITTLAAGVPAAPPPPLPTFATLPPPPLPSGPPALPVAARPAWNSLHLKRPAGKFGSGMTMVTLPQTLRVDFDRHRLTLALTGEEEASVARRGLSGSGGLTAAERASQVNLLFVMARSLEALLADKVSAEQAMLDWKQTETQMISMARDAARRGTRNFAIVMGVVVLAGVGLIAAILTAS
jgi:hypothetical protein